MDIVCVVGVLSQFLKAPSQAYWKGDIRVLVYIKHAPEKGADI